MGSAAATLLLQTADGMTAKKLITFSPEIIVRGSTAAPEAP
jgi:DNA-binding LacI/PurR family transcriptional regulator